MEVGGRRIVGRRRVAADMNDPASSSSSGESSSSDSEESSGQAAPEIVSHFDDLPTGEIRKNRLPGSLMSAF